MTTGLLDTSVVIDWDDPSVQRALPEEISVSAITLAELAAGRRTNTGVDGHGAIKPPGSPSANGGEFRAYPLRRSGRA